MTGLRGDAASRLADGLRGTDVLVGEADHPAPSPRREPVAVLDAWGSGDRLVVVLVDGAVLLRGGTVERRTVRDAERIVWTGPSGPGRTSPFRGLVAVAEPGGVTFHRPPPVRTSRRPRHAPRPLATGLVGATLGAPVGGRVARVLGDHRSLVLVTEDDATVALLGPIAVEGVGDAADTPTRISCASPVVVDRPGRDVELHEVRLLPLTTPT